MGRTPLFRMLQRAAAIARASRHVRMPLDEFHDALRARRTDADRVDKQRRRLLQGAGASALLAGCQSMPAPMRAGNGEDVVIVGAGIAGLTAAWRLRQQGVAVRVFEAQERVGGRMLSLRNHFPDGQVIELGGELIDTDHVRIRALAAELALPLDDLLEGDSDLDTWFFDGRAISEHEIVQAFVPVAAAIERDLAAAGDGDYDYKDENPAFRTLDALTISQWLDRNGVSGWLRKLLDVAYTSEMGLEIDQQSALNLLTFIGVEDKDAFRIFGTSDERSHVRGGNDLIPHTLASRMSDAAGNGARTGSGAWRCRRLHPGLPPGLCFTAGAGQAGHPGDALHAVAAAARGCGIAGAQTTGDRQPRLWHQCQVDDRLRPARVARAPRQWRLDE